MTIEVTAEDIAKGKPVKSCRCPVARAIRRATGGVVFVNGLHIVVNGRIFETPDEVVSFLDDFDDGMPVAPFTFNLPIE